MPLNKYLDGMILSASGWRGVFASDGESASPEISEERRVFASIAGHVIAGYIKNAKRKLEGNAQAAPCVIVGMDTRPTGHKIAEAVIKALLAENCAVRFLGAAAAPEIMAYARYCGRERGQKNEADGFIYISASHNPIGHNGIKIGLTDGGVLPQAASAELTASLVSALEHPEFFIETVQQKALDEVYRNAEREKEKALAVYACFADEVWTGGNEEVSRAVHNAINTTNRVGIVADSNGSARAASIDRAFFEKLGLPFRVINGEKGEIAHRIVPEGESLEPCRRLLEEAHRENPDFVIGYTCDCDGDRGNLVVWDDKLNCARALSAQEVFALCVMAELAHLTWVNGGQLLEKNAVVVNDATSLRVDRIAAAFNARVFRAEVGEANVVGLARSLRERGWTVRILGEGAAGGNITHPSAVRDPLATVMAIVKLLLIRDVADGGLYALWCKLSGRTRLGGRQNLYREDFTISSVIDTLPFFVTTSSYESEAVLHIKTADHALLKERYQKIFNSEWEMRKAEFNVRFGVIAYGACAYKGSEEISPCRDFREAGRGGLKITFYRDRRGAVGESAAFAFIWMRGSGTESAFRIMADVEGGGVLDASAGAAIIERELLAWQTRMVQEADEAG